MIRRISHAAERISTHTPARGVTVVVSLGEVEIYISTHTPARGVTGGAIMDISNINNFYSHAREGRDRSRQLLLPT